MLSTRERSCASLCNRLTAALLLTASCAALTIVGNSRAQAGSYTVSTDAELRAAITAANAEAGPSTITLTNDIVLAVNPSSSTVIPLPSPTRPLTIDTNGHTLSGGNRPAGNTFAPGPIQLGPSPP